MKHNFPHFDLTAKYNYSTAIIINIDKTWVNILPRVHFMKIVENILNYLCSVNSNHFQNAKLCLIVLRFFLLLVASQ